MARKLSAGILLFRGENGTIQVLLGHMGGPFWAHKDAGGWSIPKGEYEEGEDPFEVATREFQEEIGSPVPATKFHDLGSVKQPNGKVVSAWAAQGDLDASGAVSNTFEMEWPKGSGKIEVFPEIDRAVWLDVADARDKLLKGQVPFLDKLTDLLREQGLEARETSMTEQESLF